MDIQQVFRSSIVLLGLIGAALVGFTCSYGLFLLIKGIANVILALLP